MRLTDQWLAQREIVALEPASAAAGGTANQLPLVLDDNRADLRYSTRTLLATEQALLHTVAAGHDAEIAIVPTAIVRRVLTAHPDLSPEQAALVWDLTCSGHGIENVEAGAGAGKTHALGVAVEAFTAAGHPVLGTSTANLAARTLEQEAGIRALNTTRLLADLDGGEALAPGTILLVDEAGMVGTRKYQRLAEHVTAVGGKLIGVGDSRQLAEVEAGGAFRAISELAGIADADELAVGGGDVLGEPLVLARADHAGLVDQEHGVGREGLASVEVGEEARRVESADASLLLERPGGEIGGGGAEDLVAGGGEGLDGDAEGVGLAGARAGLDVFDAVAGGGELPDELGLLG